MKNWKILLISMLFIVSGVVHAASGKVDEALAAKMAKEPEIICAGLYKHIMQFEKIFTDSEQQAYEQAFNATVYLVNKKFKDPLHDEVLRAIQIVYENEFYSIKEEVKRSADPEINKRIEETKRSRENAKHLKLPVPWEKEEKAWRYFMYSTRYAMKKLNQLNCPMPNFNSNFKKQ